MWVWYGESALGRDARQSRELVDRGEQAGRIRQPRREAACALVDRLANERRIRSSSAAVGGRSAPPMTSRRSVLCPTNVVTFVAGRAAATASR